MESLIKYVQDEYIDQKNFPEFKAGDTITVYYEIKEGENQEHSFLKVLSFRLKERAKQKPLQLEKCPEPLGLKEYSQ